MMPDHAVREVAAIDYRCEAYDWRFAREAAAEIEAHWAAVLREKPASYDGRVLVAHAVAIHPAIDADAGGRLEAAGFETDYKSFLCWRERGFPGAAVINLFAMGALLSADGAFMVGAMGAGTTSAGRLYFPAGTPEPSDVRPDGVVDLEGNILREIAEETGLTLGDVTLDPGWTLVRDGARLACMKRARCRFDAETMVRRFSTFRAGERDPELEALVPMRSPRDFQEARMPGFMLSYLRHAFAATPVA